MVKKPDKEIVDSLRAANIPPSVYSQTLLTVGRVELRAWVAAARRTKTRGLWFYPEDAATEDYFRSQELFYLVAKELLLVEQSVGCFDLIELVDTIEAQDFRFQEYEFWFLFDFHVQGLACPYTPAQQQQLSWQLRRHIQRQNGIVVIHADTAWPAAQSWWSTTLLNMLYKHCVMVPVSAREG